MSNNGMFFHGLTLCRRTRRHPGLPPPQPRFRLAWTPSQARHGFDPPKAKAAPRIRLICTNNEATFKCPNEAQLTSGAHRRGPN